MIKPIGKRVLIKPTPKEEATKGGILLPTDSINPSFFVGTVIKVNEEVKSVSVGDVVAHKKYGMEIMKNDQDEDVYLVDESSVIAVYE